MRKILLASVAVLLFASLSFAQAPGRVEGGFYYPGVFAGPFIPLVNTPSAHWSNHLPPAGASNATEGNFAGASSYGFSGHAHLGQSWYGMRGGEMGNEDHRGREREAREEGFDSGIATSEFQESVIVAMGQPHAVAPSGTPRQITNQDVEQVNQKNGYVKYGDHVEHWDSSVTQ
jgi:hypothetical protein